MLIKSFSAFSSNIYSVGLLLALTEMYAGSMVSSAVNSQGKFHRVHSAWEWSARVIQCFWLVVRKGVWLLKICANRTQKLSLGSSGGRTGAGGHYTIRDAILTCTRKPT